MLVIILLVLNSDSITDYVVNIDIEYDNLDFDFRESILFFFRTSQYVTMQ